MKGPRGTKNENTHDENESHITTDRGRTQGSSKAGERKGMNAITSPTQRHYYTQKRGQEAKRTHHNPVITK
jgi:hypothetical protein